MARIGIEPCKPFELAKLDPAVQAALKDINPAAMKRIAAGRPSLGKTVNGWNISMGLGHYGTEYLKRSVVAAYGWPANRQDDAD
jgi:hypothetical protein